MSAFRRGPKNVEMSDPDAAESLAKLTACGDVWAREESFVVLEAALEAALGSCRPGGVVATSMSASEASEGHALTMDSAGDEHLDETARETLRVSARLLRLSRTVGTCQIPEARARCGVRSGVATAASGASTFGCSLLPQQPIPENRQARPRRVERHNTAGLDRFLKAINTACNLNLARLSIITSLLFNIYMKQTGDEPQKQDTQANKRTPLLREEVPYEITLIRLRQWQGSLDRRRREKVIRKMFTEDDC